MVRKSPALPINNIEFQYDTTGIFFISNIIQKKQEASGCPEITRISHEHSLFPIPVKNLNGLNRIPLSVSGA